MLIISLLLLCLNIILMLIFYRKISRTFSQNAYYDRIREEVNKLIFDIEHQSDHAVTILEDKIQRIQKLLTDTDKHIEIVEKEHEKWTHKQHFIQEHEKLQLIDQNKSLKNKDNPVTIYTKPNDLSEKIMPPALDPREQVIELAHQGFSIDFIAERVNLPIGEIALIFSMRG